MLAQLRPAVMVLVLLTLVTGVAYPLLVTGIAQAVFPFQAQGSLVVKEGKVGRLGPHRPAFRRPQVLLEPPVGHAARSPTMPGHPPAQPESLEPAIRRSRRSGTGRWMPSDAADPGNVAMVPRLDP